MNPITKMTYYLNVNSKEIKPNFLGLLPVFKRESLSKPFFPPEINFN